MSSDNTPPLVNNDNNQIYALPSDAFNPGSIYLITYYDMPSKPISKKIYIQDSDDAIDFMTSDFMRRRVLINKSPAFTIAYYDEGNDTLTALKKMIPAALSKPPCSAISSSGSDTPTLSKHLFGTGPQYLPMVKVNDNSYIKHTDLLVSCTTSIQGYPNHPKYQLYLFKIDIHFAVLVLMSHMCSVAKNSIVPHLSTHFGVMLTLDDQHDLLLYLAQSTKVGVLTTYRNQNYSTASHVILDTFAQSTDPKAKRTIRLLQAGNAYLVISIQYVPKVLTCDSDSSEPENDDHDATPMTNKNSDAMGNTQINPPTTQIQGNLVTIPDGVIDIKDNPDSDRSASVVSLPPYDAPINETINASATVVTTSLSYLARCDIIHIIEQALKPFLPKFENPNSAIVNQAMRTLEGLLSDDVLHQRMPNADRDSIRQIIVGIEKMISAIPRPSIDAITVDMPTCLMYTNMLRIAPMIAKAKRLYGDQLPGF